jgi:glutathione S-transferase
MSLTVYWASGSAYSWRVLLALEVKKIPYESQLLEFSKGELKTPEFIALNARGRVPAIADGGFTLYESLAILSYLDRKYPEPRLFGRTPEEAGLIMRLISEHQSYLDDHVERFIVPLYFGQAADKADQIRTSAEAIAPEIQRLEGLVSSRPWLAGDALSAADLVVFPALKSVERAASKPQARAFDLPFFPLTTQHPGFGEWMRRVEALPGYEKTYPPHWR